MRHPFRKWRVTRSRSAEKAIHELVARVVPVPDKRACVAIGAWCLQEGIRGHPKGPINAFTAGLVRRATVLLVDENYTSKLCSECHRELVPAKFKKKSRDGPEKSPRHATP